MLGTSEVHHEEVTDMHNRIEKMPAGPGLERLVVIIPKPDKAGKNQGIKPSDKSLVMEKVAEQLAHGSGKDTSILAEFNIIPLEYSIRIESPVISDGKVPLHGPDGEEEIEYRRGLVTRIMESLNQVALS